MKHCLMLEPFSESERVLSDIFDLPRVIDIVIEHRSAVVPELKLRHGHRIQKAINGGRVLKAESH